MAVVGLLTIGFVGIGIAEAAGDPGESTYTGCLSRSSGTINSLAPGSSPGKTCSGNETQITLGGGDITSVTAGTGIDGGATAGDAGVSIAPAYRLPQGCTSPNVVAKWTGTAWNCGPDNDTTYDGFDFALAGRTCFPGQVVTGISPVGLPTCAPDKDTTYSGANFAKSGASCPAGKYVSGINGSGDLVCTDLPAAATPTLDVVQVEADADIGAASGGRAIASCPAGYKLVGGGWAAFNKSVDYAGYYQFFGGPNAYTVSGGGLLGGSLSSRAFCAKIS
ncbi:MAG: hypothetical protein ACRDV2_02710 [Actinomycetes bacterium]